MPNTLGGDGATEFQGPYAAKHLNSIYKVLQSYNKVGFNKKKIIKQSNRRFVTLYMFRYKSNLFSFTERKEKKIIRTKLIKKIIRCTVADLKHIS